MGSKHKKSSTGLPRVLSIVEGEVAWTVAFIMPRKLLRAVLDRISFVAFILDQKQNAAFCLTREGLLSLGFTRYDEIHVKEFGVADGYLGTTMLARHSRAVKSWQGWDTFEGLASAWRNHPVGAFSRGGSVPPSPDPRVSYFKTNVEDLTLNDLNLASGCPTLFTFDLDLFEPTIHLVNVIAERGACGDLLDFDEAFDCEELALLVTMLRRRNASILGYSATSVLLALSPDSTTTGIPEG